MDSTLVDAVARRAALGLRQRRPVNYRETGPDCAMEVEEKRRSTERVALWSNAQPTHAQSKVDAQESYVPRTAALGVRYPPDATLDRSWPINEETHDPKCVYNKLSTAGESAVENPEALDEHRWFIDRVLTVARVKIGSNKRWHLCFLVVWSSGEFSWELVGTFKRQEEAFRVWLIKHALLPHLVSARRREALAMLLKPTDPPEWAYRLEEANEGQALLVCARCHTRHPASAFSSPMRAVEQNETRWCRAAMAQVATEHQAIGDGYESP